MSTIESEMLAETEAMAEAKRLAEAEKLKGLTDVALMATIRGKGLEGMSAPERAELVVRLARHTQTLANTVTQLLEERARLAATPTLRIEVDTAAKKVVRDAGGLITEIRPLSDHARHPLGFAAPPALPEGG